MTKRAEELAEFPPRMDVIKEDIYFGPGSNPDSFPEVVEYLSLKEHQAILAAAEKDALNSEVVKEIEIALQKCAAANERMSGAFNHEHTLSRIDIKTFAEIALEKLNNARGE